MEGVVHGQGRWRSDEREFEELETIYAPGASVFVDRFWC